MGADNRERKTNTDNMQHQPETGVNGSGDWI